LSCERGDGLAHDRGDALVIGVVVENREPVALRGRDLVAVEA
jgi:hypothetical protein